jgi:sugar lactone lactonase YvrE
MWFTETTYRFEPGRGRVATGSAIGRITPTGSITEYPLRKADSDPGGIAVGPDGNMWFTETTWHSGRRGRVFTGSAIGRITPAGRITEYPLPAAGSDPGGITTGPDGNLWFTESEGNGKIGRITPAGRITEYPLPTHPSYPEGGSPSSIVAGPDGNVWFTEVIGNKIGRITPAGVITEYHTPTGISHPAGIVAGPDGNLWFTEQLGSAIGRITPTATPTVARMTCPLAVTLHSPIPKRVGNRMLTDRITTKKSSCVLLRPQVSCEPLASSATGKKGSCDTKVTKRGRIRVTTLRGGSVRVAVSVRVKSQPGFGGRWKSSTWTGAWILREPAVATNKGETDLTLSTGLVQGMDAADVGIEATRGATLSTSGVVTFRVKSVKGNVITHKSGLLFSSSAGFVTLQNIALNHTTGKASALVEAAAVPNGMQITDLLTFTGGKNQIKRNGTWKNAKVALATTTSLGDPASLFASQLGLPPGSIASGMTIGKANITLSR